MNEKPTNISMHFLQPHHRATVWAVTVSLLLLLSGGIVSRAVQADVVDTTAPVITLEGDEDVILVTDATYEDPGATAVDNVDGTVAVMSTAPEFITKNPGQYVISYVATDAANNVTMAHRSITIKTPAELYGPVKNIKRSSKQSVTVTYANGSNAIIPLPYRQPKSVKLAASGDCLIVLGAASKHLAMVDPYTGNIRSELTARKITPSHSTLTTTTLNTEAHDELIVLATVRAKVLKLTVWKMDENSGVTSKIDSTSIPSIVQSGTPLHVKTHKRVITVTHGHQTHTWKLTTKNNLKKI